MNLATEIVFAIDESNGPQRPTQIHSILIDTQPITDLRIYIVREIKKFIDP
jgi:hypothetical protein